MKRTHLNATRYGSFHRNGHRVLCADGIIRSAELSQTADTYFSISATVRIKGKRIKGYVTTDDMGDESEYTFRPMDSEKAEHPHLVWAPRRIPLPEPRIILRGQVVHEPNAPMDMTLQVAALQLLLDRRTP